MRSYTVTVAALALNVDIKWLDNVLSHHQVRGLLRKRQGIQRQILPESMLVLAIASDLIEALSLPIARAIEVAHLMTETGARVPVSRTINLHADLDSIAARLQGRLADAIEGAAQKPRGRPVG